MTNKINKTLKERGSRYGSFEHNAKITQRLCNVLKHAPNYDLLEEEHIEAFHMIFHKIARCVCGDPNYIDNIHDIVGYAKLLEEFLKDKEKILEYFDKLEDEKLDLLSHFPRQWFGIDKAVPNTDKGFCLIVEEFDEEEEEINDKELEDEITMLTHAMQGKFGNSVNLSGLVSKKALQIFKERLKNGTI